jgi:hypothetical protein
LPSYPLPLAIVLTIVFSLSTIGFAALLFARRASLLDRVIAAVHVLMSIAMLAMPWSWGMRVSPPLAQVIVFSAVTALFLALLVAPELRATIGDAQRHTHAEHLGPLLISYHALMGAAMVVMGAAMLMGTTRHSGFAMESMPGMQMSGGGAMSSASSASAGMPAGTMQIAYWVLAVLFAAGAVWTFARSVRARRQGLSPTSDILLSTMSAGMALAFIPF